MMVSPSPCPSVAKHQPPAEKETGAIVTLQAAPRFSLEDATASVPHRVPTITLQSHALRTPSQDFPSRALAADERLVRIHKGPKPRPFRRESQLRPGNSRTIAWTSSSSR